MAERTRKSGPRETFGGRLSGWWWFADPIGEVRAEADGRSVSDGDDGLASGENPFAGEDEELAALSPRERLERLEAFSAA